MFVSLLLPPFNLVVLALLGLVLAIRYNRLGQSIAWVAVLGLVAFSMPIIPVTLLVALETGLDVAPPEREPPQAIVVLGAEIVRVADGLNRARVGALTLERLRAGAELARRTGLPVLVTGGITRRSEPPVGLLMAQSMAEDFRVPVRWAETESRDTWENATHSTAILRSAGIHSVYVVTHPWHMKRALQAFAPTGLTVTPAPTPLDTSAHFTIGDFIPRASVWETGYFALHEWVGRVWYAFR